jgi:hypothetical protein
MALKQYMNISFNVRKLVMVDLDVEALVNLLPKIPFHKLVTIKSIPPNPKGDPPKPPRSVTVAFVQHVIPYCRPFKIPLNYLEYKKDFDSDAHVRIFKADIKANDETIDEEIINLSNFTLKDNASN